LSTTQAIETPRLVATRICAIDLSYVIATDSDPAIQATLFGTVSTRDESEARLHRWLQEERVHGLGFWIFRDASSNPIGHAGLFTSRHDRGDVELGYALRPEYWGRGYATEMAFAMLAHGFDDLALLKIVATAQPTNMASRRVMEKCGLRFEREYLHEGARPSVRYTIDREAWSARSNA
jgi:ribosomal-protein-alanine N-acetyltransferase